MAQKRDSFNRSSRSRGRNTTQTIPEALVLPGALLLIGVFILLPLFFPLGLIWCAVTGWAFYLGLKKEGMVKTNVENKLDVDWKQTRDKFIRHVKAESVMEERTRPIHSHDPVSYSYDKCARDRRLEQLKDLKEAGLLDENEYKQRCQNILAGK